MSDELEHEPVTLPRAFGRGLHTFCDACGEDWPCRAELTRREMEPTVYNSRASWIAEGGERLVPTRRKLTKAQMAEHTRLCQETGGDLSGTSQPKGGR